jgi:AcrR family transcriptional regulator
VSKVHQKQEKRRAEVLEKVMDLLKEKSFEEISVQDICNASDISVGSFYHYFSQKSELLTGLMGMIDFYMTDHVFPFLVSESAYENLKILSRGFAAYVEESGIKISKLISGSCPTDYSLSNEKRPFYMKLSDIISTGQMTGEFRDDMSPEQIADLLLVALSGVAVDWSRRDGNYPIKSRMEEYTDLFFPALLGSKTNIRKQQSPPE